MVDMTEWNQRKKKDWYYPDVESVQRPIPLRSEVPVPIFTSLPDLTADATLLEAMEDTDSSWNYSSTSVATAASSLSTKPKPFSQGQLNELVRDLNLCKESLKILASRLGDFVILDSRTKITFYHNRDDLLIRFFTTQDEFVYCNNIPGLLKEMGLSYYNLDEWRLFIDSSKRSLKCWLLHEGNKFSCVPMGHSVVVKKHYLNVKMVLNKLGYNVHNWAICADFEMVDFLLLNIGGTPSILVFSVTGTVQQPRSTA